MHDAQIAAVPPHTSKCPCHSILSFTTLRKVFSMLRSFQCRPCAMPSRKCHALQQRSRGRRVTSVRVVADGEHAAAQHVASRRVLLGGALLGFSICQGGLDDGPDGPDTRMFIQSSHPARNRLLINKAMISQGMGAQCLHAINSLLNRASTQFEVSNALKSCFVSKQPR